MGQKAKNAGKKISKTCDRKANGKSVHCKRSKVRLIMIPDSERRDVFCYFVAKEAIWTKKRSSAIRIDL
jgi:hypothetical protein